MKKLISVFLILISTAIYGQTGEKNFIDQNYLEVSGKAELEIIPDEIYLKIIIDEKDNKAKKSLEELEKAMVSKLKDIGIDISKDLTIKDFASNFQSYWLKKSDIYTTKEYQLIVHEGLTLGKVFVELEKLGISNIDIARVDHSKLEVFKKEVKIKAIQAAKEKANYLATAIDQSVGKAMFIAEIDNNFPFAPQSNTIITQNFSSYKSEDKAFLNLEFEKIKLESTIMVRFELK